MLPISYCPDCGHKLEAATGIEGDDHTPAPGDVSICINCTAFLQFDDNLYLISLPSTKDLPKEIADLLFRARRTIHRVQRKKRRKTEK